MAEARLNAYSHSAMLRWEERSGAKVRFHVIHGRLASAFVFPRTAFSLRGLLRLSVSIPTLGHAAKIELIVNTILMFIFSLDS